jgi:glycosyltransferase involved in cell wall biosynthesis
LQPADNKADMVDDNLPTVSIIVPCFNEQETILLLLNAIKQQKYPISKIETIIADGRSTDRTVEVVSEFKSSNLGMSIQVVENPKRVIPSGLNLGIKSANGEIIVRLDAHSIPEPDYLLMCVEGLENGKGDNVGGIWVIKAQNKSWQARSIAIAASHKLGIGDARYRYTNQAQVVDTVPFGSYYRSTFDKIGLFDETLHSNEDYEFNARLRKNGGRIWLDPDIKSIYFARKTFRDLSKQYWRYGYWKAQMLKRFPETIKWRQGLPPLFIISLVLFTVLSAWFFLPRIILLIEIFIYLSILGASGIIMALNKKDPAYLFGVPISIGIMHISWGSAFLCGFLKTPKKIRLADKAPC